MADFPCVHSIMMEKSALAGEVGGARPPPFTLFSITYKLAVYAPAERADTLPLFFISTHICTLWSYVRFILKCKYCKIELYI
jgi:hypothetical protein